MIISIRHDAMSCTNKAHLAHKIFHFSVDKINTSLVQHEESRQRATLNKPRASPTWVAMGTIN